MHSAYIYYYYYYIYLSMTQHHVTNKTLSFKYLIKHAQFKYIFLSYNNEGLMSAEFIKNVMQEYGDYSLIKKEYKRFHTHKSTNPDQLADTTYEYLHVIIKK